MVLAPLLSCDVVCWQRFSTFIARRSLMKLSRGRAGRIQRLDAERIGYASLLLGGGRSRSEDKVDFVVGLSEIKKIGTKVDKDEALMRVHARDHRSLQKVLPLLKEAAVIE
jgi:pyrimidine-nucleoside phosphorylase